MIKKLKTMNHQFGLISLSYDLIPISARDSCVGIDAPMPLMVFEQLCDSATTPMIVTVPLAAFSNT
jgi:hypothetical protein